MNEASSEAQVCEVAALLPPFVCESFASQCPDLSIKAVKHLSKISPTASVLLAVPSRNVIMEARPDGWPFSLRWVHVLTAGLDGYPKWFLDEVPVTHSPGASAVPIAEFCLALILSHSKHLHRIRVHEPDQWRSTSLVRVHGSSLGLVGFGSIAAAVASRAVALGMQVQAFRRSNRPLPDEVTRAASLEELFATSDHVVIAVPSTPQTDGMIGASVLNSAREGVHLINIARGRIIDDAALLDALDRGVIGRASLDVTEPEPLPAGHPFYAHPKIFLSPHTSGIDNRILADLVDMFKENWRRVKARLPLLWHVHGDNNCIV